MQLSTNFKQSELTLLITFNVLLFVLVAGLASLGGPSLYERTFSELLIGFGALSGGLVFRLGEPWRLVTSMFLHVDILHLAFNMLALYRLGMIVKNYYSGKLLFAFYILAGLGGSILSIIFLDPRIPTVGASGAVFGLLGVLVAGSYKGTHQGFDLPFRTIDVLPLAAYSFMFGLIPNSGINNFAHLGGFVTGLLLGWLFSNQMSAWRMKLQKKSEKALFYICGLIMTLSYVAVIINLYLLIT